jgi:hypothetical protein
MAEGTDDRAGDAVAHLQAAAREMIAAARAFLDVAEEVVEDPQAGEAILHSLGDVARRARPSAHPDDGDGPVEHITVD